MAELLPDIPRWYTGIAEWAAAVVYILLTRPRVSPVRRYVWVVAALPVFIALQEFAGQLPLALWTFGMAAAVVAIFAFIYLTCDVSTKDAGYLTARAFVLAELVASLQWQLWVHWTPRTPSLDLGTGKFLASIALLIGAYGIAFFAAHRLERRNFPQPHYLGVDAPTLVLALAIGLATFLVSNLSFLTPSTPFSGQAGMDIFYIRTLVDLAGFVALYAQQSHRNQVSKAMELAQANIILQSQQEQFLQSKRNIEELNRIHHDFKYYVDAIRQEKSADQRSEYLQRLEDTLRGHESQIQTGNDLLDVILSSKMERCLQEGISMTHVVDGKALDFVDPLQLSALFGNALDNAIEACLKIPESEKRLIKVSAYSQHQFVIVRVENYWPHPVDFVDGLPQSTKSDRAKHGFGTSNMRKIVHRYGGTLKIDVADDWYRLSALLPKPQKRGPK